jgi:uncharacterized membrane protein
VKEVTAMMFPGYADYGFMTWMMVASMVTWIALIVLVVVLIMRIAPRLDREDRTTL